jgi:hypothetical protein
MQRELNAEATMLEEEVRRSLVGSLSTRIALTVTLQAEGELAGIDNLTYSLREALGELESRRQQTATALLVWPDPKYITCISSLTLPPRAAW